MGVILLLTYRHSAWWQKVRNQERTRERLYSKTCTHGPLHGPLHGSQSATCVLLNYCSPFRLVTSSDGLQPTCDGLHLIASFVSGKMLMSTSPPTLRLVLSTRSEGPKGIQTDAEHMRLLRQPFRFWMIVTETDTDRRHSSFAMILLNSVQITSYRVLVNIQPVSFFTSPLLHRHF